MIQKSELNAYVDYLTQKELAKGTIDIYVRQASLLLDFLGDRKITKAEIIAYKNKILQQKKKMTTVNLCIVSINNYLKYAGFEHCSLKTERIQKKHCVENIIHIDEYQKLIAYAKESNREKYYYILKVLLFTRIRVSELSFLTVECLSTRKIYINNKGTTREIYLQDQLVAELAKYCFHEEIHSGVIFRGNRNTPISRIAIYKILQHFADMTGVPKENVHPHSFRHLFALTYIKQYSDLTELSDILGHSNLETTRIYTMTTAEEKRHRLNNLKFD